MGTDSEPDGALSVLANGLNQAIANYNANEAAVTNLFSASSGTPASTVDQPTGYVNANEYLFHTTAVNES
jgi:hypothetical protein